MFKVGTSGYSFADWVGSFYPPGTEKGKMLDYYKDYFNCVEINSTYYRIPHSKVFYFMAEKTQDNFDFIVKTHKEFTHIRDEKSDSSTELMEAVKPLIETGKLKGFLAQFPWSFKFNNSNFEYLMHHLNDYGEIPLFLEFRHNSWIKSEVIELLRAENVGFCNVDEPQSDRMLRPSGIATNNIGYVRFHGRNMEKWWSGGGERYNYDYSENELRGWIDYLKKLERDTETVYLFFNNCHQGQAVKNAKMMMHILREEFREK